MLVKVCGLNDLNSIQELELIDEISYYGFIFYDKSKRYLTIDVPKFTLKNRVGVFVNSSLEFIENSVEKHQLDLIQLHGDESIEFCKEAKNIKPIIKAFGVSESFDFSLLEAFESHVTYFLFDTKTSDYGGSGKLFDWNVLEKYQLKTPFFLSGGLSLTSIKVLNEFSHPKCVGIDLNSGFEVSPGIKNSKQINDFISNLK